MKDNSANQPVRGGGSKFLDRLHYALSSPWSLLRLLYATGSNRVHAWTRELGPRRVVCNLCGFTGRRFDYFLERQFVVKNSQCPGCGSQTRNRELAAFIERHVALPGKWVLDVAPAPRYAEWFRARGAHYLSIDLGEREAMARMDVTRLALCDHRFELIICSHVLEHVRDDLRALQELRRVLRPGGQALIAVPFSRQPATIHLAAPDHQGHLHNYGRDIISRLESAGFKARAQIYNSGRDHDDPDNQFFQVEIKD